MKAVGQSWQTVFFLLERVLFTHQTSVVAIARSSVSDAARVRSNRGAPRFRRFRLFCGVRVVRYFIPAKSRPQRPNRGNARVTDRQRDSSRAVECENAVKSRSFSVCFPWREIHDARTSHRARTHGTNVAHGACEPSHAAEPSTSRARETRTRTRAARLAPVLGESPDNGSRSHLQSRHAGRQQGGRGGAQARRGGSRDRGGPVHARTVPRDHRAPQRVRRAHGARARDARSSVRPSPRAERLPRQRHIARLDARAPPRASREAYRATRREDLARDVPRRRAHARLDAHAPIRRARRPRVPAPSLPHRFPALRLAIRARASAEDDTSRLNARTAKKLTVRFTRFRLLRNFPKKNATPQRVQAGQEEAFVQPGGVDVRQGFFRQKVRGERARALG